MDLHGTYDGFYAIVIRLYTTPACVHFQYYDTIVVGIAASVLGGVALGIGTALGFRTRLFAGSLLATVFTYDAMIRNPPLPTADPE